VISRMESLLQGRLSFFIALLIMNPALKHIGCSIVLALTMSCKEKLNNNNASPETQTVGNISTTLSSDTAKLSKLINLRIYKPTAAKFKYTFMDNSGQNERLSTPGPSDSYLEAILYFDSATFAQLLKDAEQRDSTIFSLSKEKFNFDWLDQSIKDELTKSEAVYEKHSEVFAGSSEVWFLDNKLLLRKAWN
jgi:hypothetical protein